MYSRQAGAAAHHGDRRRRIPLRQRLPQRPPAAVKIRHRFHRHRVLLGAGHGGEIRGGAHVQAHQVVFQVGAVVQVEPPLLGLEPYGAGADKARAGGLAKALQIDMGLFQTVVARDQPRQLSLLHL